MTPTYKVTYFPFKGLGECIRYLLIYGGIEFEDKHIEIAEWPKCKREVNGKTAYQSIAIARYLAKQFQLTGNNDWENLEIDAIVYTVNDFRSKIANYHYETNERAKAAHKEFLDNETIPYYLDRLEAIAKANNGHLAVGKTNITTSNFFETEVNIENKSILTHYFDDHNLVLEDSKSNVLVFDPCTGKCKGFYPTKREDYINSVNVDGDNLAILTSKNYVTIWNTRNGIKVAAVRFCGNFILAFTVLHKNWYAMKSLDSVLKICDMDEERCCFEESNVSCVCLYDNKAAFGSTHSSYLTILNLETQEKYKTQCFERFVISRIISKNGTLLCFNDSGDVGVFSGKDGTKKVLFSIINMTNRWNVHILDDYRIVINGSDDNFLQVWDYILGKRLVIAHTGDEKDCIRIWCSITGKLLTTVEMKSPGMIFSSFFMTASKLTYQRTFDGKDVAYILDYEKNNSYSL